MDEFFYSFIFSFCKFRLRINFRTFWSLSNATRKENKREAWRQFWKHPLSTKHNLTFAARWCFHRSQPSENINKRTSFIYSNTLVIKRRFSPIFAKNDETKKFHFTHVILFRWLIQKSYKNSLQCQIHKGSVLEIIRKNCFDGLLCCCEFSRFLFHFYNRKG